MANQKSHTWRRTRLLVAGLVVGIAVLCYWAFSESAHHRSDSERVAAVREGSTQAPVLPEPEPDVAPAPLKRALLVRDLGSGEPVAGVSFVLRFKGERIQKTMSDDSGTVAYLGEGLREVEVTGEEWTVARSLRMSDAVQSGVVWIFRQLEVVGTVRASDESDEFDPRTVRFTAIVDDEDGGVLPWNDGPSWRARWQVARRSQLELSSMSKDGEFVLRLPRINGVVLGASASGWRPSIVRLNEFLGASRARVDLKMTRGFVVRGVLVDQTGAPMSKQLIQGMTVVRAAKTEVAQYSKLQLRQPDGAFGGAADTVTGEGFARYQHTARTDKDGAFELSVGIVGGTTFIWAYIKGYEPVELEVGQLQTDRESIRMQAQIARGKPVSLSEGGNLLRRQAVVVGDLDFGLEEVQPGIQVWTNPDGLMSTDWLVSGRRYSLMWIPHREGKADPAGIVHGCIVWTGQSRIDVKTDLRTYEQLFPKQR